MSIIDLSEVRPTKVEKKVYTSSDLIAAMEEHKKTMVEAVDTRYKYMIEMGKALDSKIAPLPGQPHPAQETERRLRFLDVAISQSHDCIVAGTIILEDYENPQTLAPYPALRGQRDKVAEIIVTFITEKRSVADFTQEQALLVAGFRDFERFRRVLNMVK